MKSNFWILVFFLLIFQKTLSQTVIEGGVFDLHKKPVANAMIILYDDNTNKIIEYAQSGSNGSFALKKKHPTGIYRLEASKLGFEKINRHIVIATNNENTITVNLLLPEEFSELDEIVIETQRPIIVKKDTILYDIKHFTKHQDQSLEEVLAKIEGFKIQADGSIEVNGQTIRKVLVDGKEVSDFGAGMITKSLDPSKVDNVEVRFDEKNAKIKEKLLNDERFVVLDIKLKKDVKKTFFGKQRLDAGYRNNTKIGGLTNLFSLNDKINIQFFAENNNFNQNTIRITQIKNIGDEAFTKMLSLPVDIDDIKSRDGYHSELYGFSNFKTNNNSIVGVSLNVPVSKKSDFYFGSFSNYHFIKNSFTRQMFLGNYLVNSYNENNFINEYNSKNKIQFKFTDQQFKLTTDFNYTYFDQQLNNYVISAFENNFNKKHFSNNYYFNNRAEWAINNKLGLSNETVYANENFLLKNNLKTENTSIKDFLGLSLNDDFFQNNSNKQQSFNNTIKLRYAIPDFGNHTLGYRYQQNELTNTKHSNSLDFSVEKQQFKNQINTGFYNYTQHLGKFYTDITFEYSYVRFPQQTKEYQHNYKTKGYIQYDMNINYNLDNFTNLAIKSMKRINPFTLQNYISGNVLMDYQTVFITNTNLLPYYNTTNSVTFNRNFQNKQELNLAFLTGVSKNQNNQSFQHDLIFTSPDQLKSSFYLLSSSYKKGFYKTPLSLEIVPEFLINTNQYIPNTQTVEQTKAQIYLTELKLNYAITSNVSLHYRPKYTHMLFDNSLSPNRVFNFLTNYIAVTTHFVDEKLRLSLNYQQVNFYQNKDNFNNLNFEMVYKDKKYRYFVILNNVFNERNFITEELNNSFLNISNNSVFGRFINFGFEFKFN